MSEHRCHARECSEATPPRLLMCGRHWRMVPPLLRDEVNRTFVPGQGTRVEPTRAYLDAARAAINAVAEAEGLS